ncbi:MAG: thiamine pyrophosphate-binding protein, partial [Actinobacteria bacterium]|nr:thiamine pyrophosphate-binding protein [Actinomycetota bacterium]
MARDLARPLVEGLRDAGVRKIFGMPGGGPNLDMIGCAEDVGIEFVLAHGESAACIMAGSYGRLTGTPGVALVTRGPGLAQATLDRFPLMLISDIVSQEQAGRVAHQRIDQVATAAPVTKWSATLGARDQVEVVRSAARLAVAAPAGAVHLAFDPSAEGDTAPVLPEPPQVDDDTLDRARRLCAAARRPVVVVGLDAAPHAETVRAALETLDCPVLVTYEAKGTVPESSPTYAGLFTGAAVERPWLEQADLVLGLGLDPVEAMPGPWPYAAPVVMLHSHPVETPYFGEPHLVVGAYADYLELLVDCLRPDWPTGVAAEQRRVDVASLEHPTPGLSPHDVVRETRLARRDALVTVDAGAHMLVVMPLWETDEAGSV